MLCRDAEGWGRWLSDDAGPGLKDGVVEEQGSVILQRLGELQGFAARRGETSHREAGPIQYRYTVKGLVAALYSVWDWTCRPTKH